MLLTLAPVYGTPALKVGSTASYSFVSSLSATQSCTAAPIAYAYQACVGVSPSPSPIFVAGWHTDRQSANTGTTTDTLTICNLRGGCQAGDTIIVNYWQCCSTGQSLVNVTDTQGNSYSEIVLANGANGNNVFADVWGATSISAATSSLTVTVAYPNQSHYRAIFVQQYRNVLAFGTTSFTGQSSCTSASESLATTRTNSLVAVSYNIGFMTGMTQSGGPAASNDFSYNDNYTGWGLFLWDSQVANIGPNSWTWNVAGCKSTYESVAIELIAPAIPPPPPPMPSAFQIGLNGNIGWNVEGLSSSTANLLVTHNLQVSIPVPQLPIVTITPVTESGTLVQSIDLATRVESAGTATDLIEHVLDALAASSSSQGFNSGFGNVISQMSATATTDPSYTLWWVNGPMSDGSPVQVMDGWASVTGSETLNLGDLGSVQAWVVTSQFTQGVNLTVPSSPFGPAGPNAHAALDLNFLWSYDKNSDLLARSSANGTITMHSQSSTQVPTNGYCFSYPCAYTTVQVTRDMQLTITIALHLTSTSLSLDQRVTNGSSTIQSMLASMFATPWSALGFVGIVAAAIVALSLWLTRRVRKSAIHEAMGPPTPPPAASQ